MLRDYDKKRDFDLTPEPPAETPPAGDGALTFVVQKHSARQLHYDFRLELDGVLKSWAVAKGPSLDPQTKRLAVMVEDHPLDYATFEGGIPKGQYGAGQVIVWDRGTYSPDEDTKLSFDDRSEAEERMRQGLAAGKLSFHLRGEKMKGSWTLVKMARQEKNWLLIKHRDSHADPDKDILAEEQSVISGVTIEDLKSGKIPHKQQDSTAAFSETDGAVKKDLPSKLAPMLATPVDKPFSGDRWIFEPKLDGYRTLAFIDNGQVKLQSRNGVNVTEHYPALAESLANQPVSQMLLDGELIAFDSQGKLCFQCLQNHMRAMNRLRGEPGEPPSAIVYYVFDILYLDGYDLTRVPLLQRKKLLQSTLETSAEVRLVEHFTPDGKVVYKSAIQNGLEGVVAKLSESRYEPGKRSDAWLKIKEIMADEFVVGGFTTGKGNRKNTFGALLLGQYGDGTKLHYAGNVGGGFDSALLTSLRKRLNDLKAAKNPFADEPEVEGEVTWVKPEMVVEVKFKERTRDGRLRMPVFLRVRDDKPAKSVRPVEVVEREDAMPKKKQTEIKPDSSGDILEQLAVKKENITLEVDGEKISFSHLDKALWPALGKRRELTKRDLITYLAKVSALLLPHLKDRPLTLSRYPNGIGGEHFFQKHYDPVPGFVETVSLSSHDTPARDYLLCNNLATLLWLGQIGNIELHSWFSRVTKDKDFKVTKKGTKADFFADYPDFIIFDIDPYIYSGKEAAGDEPELNRVAFKQTCKVASEVKKTLDSLSFPSFVKTSGRTGLHIFVPILRQLDYHATHSAANTLCQYLQKLHPKEITTDWAVEKRTGKIFLDYNQNVRGKTLASIYSPRPSPEGSVSVPLHWDELDDIYPTDFTILNAPDRLAETGDLWADILDAKIDLVKILEKSGLDGDGELNDY